MTARYFLDTHTFIWAHTDEHRLSAKARRILSNAENSVTLSVISVWEIAVKYALGKLPLPEPPEQFIAKIVAESGYEVLPLKLNHALRAAALPSLHRDPFDRLLVCQALAENGHIITADEQIQQYPVRTIW